MEVLLWYALLAAWIGSAIVTMVYLVKRRTPAWIIVLVAVALLVLPVITAAVFWTVVAVRRVSRPKDAGPGPALRAGGPAWPPPASGHPQVEPS